MTILQTKAQITISGSNGKDGTYTSLTNAAGAFLALNGASQVGYNITITITADVTTEAGTNALTGAAGMWTSLTIQPSGARIIGGGAGLPIFKLSGAKNVTIDGLNSGGNSLTIQNTWTTNTSGTATIQFLAGAQNNTIKNCTILGNPQAYTSAIIYFNSSTTTANSGNTITYCNIGPYSNSYTCAEQIYSYGASTGTNSNTTITYNNFYNFTTAYGAIYHSTNAGTGWNISNNSFYRTSSAYAAYPSYAIYLNPSVAYVYTITNNYIGGQSANGGSASTPWNNGTGAFTGIYLSGTSSTASTITGNVIQNFSSTTTTQTYAFCGINIAAGAANIGDGTDDNRNIIGNNNANLGVTITSSSANSIVGIVISASSSYTITINNNLIANLREAGTANANQVVYGIYYSSTCKPSISNCQIYALSNATGYTTSTVLAAGIYTNGSGSATGAIIANNIIHNISTTNSGTANVGQLYGISYTGASAVGGTTAVYNNKIWGLYMATTSTVATVKIAGINIAGGTGNYYNNIIQLGLKPSDGSSITSPIGLIGIYCSGGATYGNNLYFNSVYIGGTGVGSTANNTYCYQRAAAPLNNSANWEMVKNNIFYNNRQNSGSGGLHYAIVLNNTTYFTSSDYNDIVSTSGNVGSINGGTTSLNWASWKSSIPGGDSHSVNSDPNFNTPDGSDATTDLHLNSPNPCEAAAITISTPSIITDIDGDIRCPGGSCPGSASAPDIGADESASSAPPSILYTSLSNTINVTTASLTATITSATSSINTTSGSAPRLYYRRFTDNNVWVDNTQETNGWKWVEQTSPSGNNYTFNIDYSKIYNSTADPVDAGDYIQYFVVAQDNSALVGINGATPASSPLSSVADYAKLFAATSLNQYWILPSSGTYTIGAGGQPTYNYATLTAANGFFAGMNDANTLITGNITLNISTDITTEDGTNGLNQWTEDGGGSYYLTIKPDASAARSITGAYANAAGLFRLNGADRVTFDGSNGTTNRYFTFGNTTAGYPTFTFVNEATYNTITYCNIYSSNTTSGTGTILFSTSAASGSLGNSNNEISFCDIYAGVSVPYNAIYSLGTTGKLNSSNTIKSNFIRNFTNYGLNIASTGNGNGWVIGGENSADGNSIYNEAARSTALVNIYIAMGNSHIIRNNSIFHNAAANTSTFTGIQIAGSGNGITIRDNYIGGTSAQCGGTSLLNSYSGSGAFTGIIAAVGTTTDAEIHNNTIKNITNSGAASTFTGIAITAGIVNIGTTVGNTIGDAGAESSITLSGSGATSPITVTGSGNGSDISNNTIAGFTTSSTNAFVGINLTVGTTTQTTVEGNTIKKITMNGNVASTFKGIYVTAGKVNIGDIAGNTIGDPDLTNYSSITYAGTSTCYGIYSTASAASVISNNNIANIYASYSATGTGVQLVGIFHSASASMTIQGNVIKYLKSNYGNTTTIGATPSVIGISFTSATAPVTISQNTIHTLKNVYTATSVISYVEGIYASLPTSGSNYVSRNFVHSLYVQNVNTGDGLCGIYLAVGLYTCDNNMVRLGIDDAGADITNNYLIYGIYQASATATSNIYFNSVYRRE